MIHYKDFLFQGKWQCTSCGACCSYIKPLADNGKIDKSCVSPDGSCKNLKDNKCVIYETRPDICRIDKTLSHLKDRDIAKMCASMKIFKGKLNVDSKN